MRDSYHVDINYLDFMLAEQLTTYTRLKCTNEAIIDLVDRLERLMQKETSIKDIPNIYERHLMIKSRAMDIKRRLEDKIARANQLVGGVSDIMKSVGK